MGVGAAVRYRPGVLERLLIRHRSIGASTDPGNPTRVVSGRARRSHDAVQVDGGGDEMSSSVPVGVENTVQQALRARKVLSRLKRSDDDADIELFGLLHKPARKVVYGAAHHSLPAYRMFKQGFTLGEATHRAFSGETKHFDLSPKDLSAAYLEGVAKWWQWKLDELYVKNDADHESTECMERARVLDGLQALLDDHVWPLLFALKARPELERVVLDVY